MTTAESSRVKIQNPYRTGLFAGLGVITALVIGGAIGSLATILTWVGAALFLALGLDPLVTWLEKHKVKRPVAILITLVGVLGVFVGLVFALIPVIVEQVGNVVVQIQDGQLRTWRDAISGWAGENLPWLDVEGIVSQALAAIAS